MPDLPRMLGITGTPIFPILTILSKLPLTPKLPGFTILLHLRSGFAGCEWRFALRCSGARSWPVPPVSLEVGAMYSVVLMLALNGTAVDAPAFGHRGCH